MLKLSNPYTMMVSGQTGSGKTYFVEKLIQNQTELHETPFEKIVLAYGVLQPNYLQLLQKVSNLELTEGFPDDFLDRENDGQVLLVLDDLMVDLESDKRLPMLFTRMRHKTISTIFIVQNLYFQSKYMTTVNRNAQYLVIFPNPRDMGMINTVGRQMFPTKPKFLPDAFHQATSTPFGYLLIDSKPGTDEKFRVRDNVFPGEVMRIYLPK